MSDYSGGPNPEGHALGDHAMGEALLHKHLPGLAYDHDHDHFDDDGPLEDNPLWIADHVSLNSVGIDIGSSGTQIVFSRVQLRRLGEDMSSRYFVTSRETLFESPVALTPYSGLTRIDEHALGQIIDAAYAQAGMRPEDIDTGAVILTGEALRRENAEAITQVISAKGGDFVCASAGHHMEAMLAAYGSGAASHSSATGERVLNIDIGGGTTKLALIEKGRVVATAAFHVGGRLLVADPDGLITRLEPAGAHLADLAGFHWHLGQRIDRLLLAHLAGWMADAVARAIQTPSVPDVAGLYLTDPLPDLGQIDAMMISGGVAEYVHGREERDFGDLGRLLGTALRQRIAAGVLPWKMLPNAAPIRATALGASEYSIQLSGNTIYVSDAAAMLPRRNLAVVAPDFDCPEIIDPQALAAAIQRHLTDFDLVDGESEFALAFRWRGMPEYSRVAALAEGIIAGLPRSIAEARPIHLVLDGDVARTLGGVLREDYEIASPLLVIDGVVLWDFDFIDLGRVRLPSGTVPVTVKSLVFRADPHAPAVMQSLADQDHHHHHHHDGHSHAHIGE